jgi:hypothetical protein
MQGDSANAAFLRTSINSGGMGPSSSDASDAGETEKAEGFVVSMDSP